jgi:hypothetical protein
MCVCVCVPTSISSLFPQLRSLTTAKKPTYFDGDDSWNFLLPGKIVCSEFLLSKCLKIRLNTIRPREMIVPVLRLRVKETPYLLWRYGRSYYKLWSQKFRTFLPIGGFSNGIPFTWANSSKNLKTEYLSNLWSGTRGLGWLCLSV